MIRTVRHPISAAAVLLALGLLTACGGDSAGTPSPEPTAGLTEPAEPAEGAGPSEVAEPTPSQTTAEAEPTPEEASPSAGAPVSLASDASGWLAGNLVTLTGSTFDAATGQVVVTAEVENTATSESFSTIYHQWLLLDTGSGAPVQPSSISSPVPLGSTTEVELTFSVPEVDLGEAVLQLGPAGMRQWLVPLAPGATGTGDEPREVAAPGVLDVSGLTFTVVSAQVVPWACSGADDYGPSGTGRVTFEPVKEGKAGVLVWGDVAESVSYTGGNGITVNSLLQPDGLTVNGIGGIWHTFAAGDRVEDVAFCFTVDEPVTGDYTLSLTTYRVGAGTLPITLG